VKITLELLYYKKSSFDSINPNSKFLSCLRSRLHRQNQTLMPHAKNFKDLPKAKAQ
jgi:hypothetical protein